MLDYIDEESVDFDYLISLVEEDLREASATDDLIDKFLELKDLRITVDEDADFEPLDIAEGSEVEYEDGFASEELAQIYYQQGEYAKAKDIYNQLFLLYSEKITYFATQIAELSKKEGDKARKR